MTRLVLVVSVVLALPARAQAVLIPTEDWLGGYGGPLVGVTWIAGRPVVLGGGALIATSPAPRSIIGLDLTVTEGDVDGLSLASLDGRFEYEVMQVYWLHFAFAMKLGGSLVVRERQGALTRDGIVQIEPQLRIAARLFEGTRLAFFAGYRLTSPVANGTDLSGGVVGLQVQEGVFPDNEAVSRWHLMGNWQLRLTSLGGAPTLLDGGGTRVLVDDTWAVGVGGFVPREWFSIAPSPLRLAYFSATGEYLFARGSVVRPSAALGVGLGGLSRASEVGVVFIVEPTLGVHVTLTRYMRACLEASYRFAPCLACPPGLGVPNGSALALGFGLRFGAFGR